MPPKTIDELKQLWSDPHREEAYLTKVPGMPDAKDIRAAAKSAGLPGAIYDQAVRDLERCSGPNWRRTCSNCRALIDEIDQQVRPR